MALQNKWVGYITRSHLQIKNSVLQRLGESNPEITDHSESNILVIIISIFSGIAEMLNYYIDNMAREAFITTARRYSSVVKHTRLIDYRIKARIPSSVDITVQFRNSLQEPVGSPISFVIPKGTSFNTGNNVNFLSVTDTYVMTGNTTATVSAQQKTFVDSVLIGTTDGTLDQVFSLGNNYVNNSITLNIDGEPWELVDTLGRAEPEDRVFIVDISVDKIAYIKFGDNINGKIPDAGKPVVGSYYISEGADGNVDPGTISVSNFNFSIVGDPVTNVFITNKLKATAGTDYEDIERIRRSAPLHLRTLDRAVTEQDYIDTAKLAPGVDKAIVHYDCGKYVDIYISPNGGGIAQSSLLQTTLEYFKTRKMITTFLNIQPAGESYIYLDIEVWAKFRMDGIQTKNDVINALIDAYGYEKSDVNRKIRRSDIIALIDNLYRVDYLNLYKILMKPYVRPLLFGKAFMGEVIIGEGSNIKQKWKLQFDGIRMRLFKNNLFITNIEIGTTYQYPGNVFSITVLNNDYDTGNEWEFYTYSYNTNIETDDFSVPVIRAQDINIKVNEQLSI